jgi:hypothetical protein
MRDILTKAAGRSQAKAKSVGASGIASRRFDRVKRGREVIAV